jgi:hypothetical protein
LWLIVRKGYARLEDLKTTWGLADILKALAIIQMEGDIFAAMMPETPKQ